MSTLPDALDHRTSDHPIVPLFLQRWSPRAMSGEPLSPEERNSLFEAARWAPSTYNEQEWRFLYAVRDTAHWETFLGLLMEANQAWCVRAGMLIVGTSCKVMSRNGKPNPVHTLDCGLAVENLLLQGASMGLVCHAMAGFDRGKARAVLGVPENYDVEVMIAVGRPGSIDDLPENYRDMDRAPSGRKPLEEIVAEGPFAF
ncbi:MAG: nitroreductase [Planctomycetota bacterium]|nr:MAG: nitroreductase [Planctomycetota bacterium]REJ97551.1 MAG: nitroreductase [Planctomycetota bacterium]REK26922.1 MAG: nitroreductase [Planctomycetota bacterium]REK35411.1 MAG: nitroreductase [Planctomycetota bacterium]